MNRLFTQYREPLLRFFSRHAQNAWDAEELTQEVFCKILKRDRGVADQYPESHVYTIAWSVLRDRARRDKVRQRGNHVEFDEVTGNAASLPLEQQLASEQQYQRFLACLEALKPKTRNIFLLSRYEGMTYTEIADHYGLSVSAVEKHMIKALTEIKKSLSAGASL